MRPYGFEADPTNFEDAAESLWVGPPGARGGPADGSEGMAMQYKEMAPAFELSNTAVGFRDNQQLVFDLVVASIVPRPADLPMDRHWGARKTNDTGKSVDHGGYCGGENERPCNEMAAVPVRSLDGMVSEGRFGHPSAVHVQFLKIDVEGYEPDVLLGAWKLLEAHAIDVVHFECSWMWQSNPLGWTLQSATERLSAIGYDVFSAWRCRTCAA